MNYPNPLRCITCGADRGGILNKDELRCFGCVNGAPKFKRFSPRPDSPAVVKKLHPR